MESLPSANIRQHKLDQQRKLIEVIFFLHWLIICGLEFSIFFVSDLLIEVTFVVLFQEKQRIKRQQQNKKIELSDLKSGEILILT